MRKKDLACRSLLMLALLAACGDEQLAVKGPLGQPIPLLSGDGGVVPRLLVHADWDGCRDIPGPCESICTQAPCPKGACIKVSIDSTSLLTALPSTQPETTSQRVCLGLRNGEGALSTDALALQNTVTRLEFLRLPALSLAEQSDVFTLGERGDVVSGVLGGPLLTQFATEFTPGSKQRADEEASAPAVRFYRTYPGSEALLAGQGRAYLAVQYPGRLGGVESSDLCQISGQIGCNSSADALELPVLPVEATQMVVDTCISRPPCEVAYDPTTSTCSLRSSHALNAPQCTAAAAGSSLVASLMVGTAIPGLTLFEDSATRFFGPLGDLVNCNDIQPTDATVTACRVEQSGTLSLPGWPSIPITHYLRVRSLAVTSGTSNAAGANPCDRVAARLEGLLEQCKRFTATSRPGRPQTTSSTRSVDFDHGIIILGLNRFVGDASSIGWDDWLETRVVGIDSSWVIGLRRAAGSDVAGLDGVLGTALLRRADTVLDTTEDLIKPGLRVRCSGDDHDSCLSMPACGGSGLLEERSCCYGLPQTLLLERLQSNASTSTQSCCGALSPASRSQLLEQLGNTACLVQ